jgi:hypothetical protein
MTIENEDEEFFNFKDINYINMCERFSLSLHCWFY